MDICPYFVNWEVLRPDVNKDEDLQMKVSEKLAPKVIAWLKRGLQVTTDTDEDEIREDLLEMISDATDDDGFELAVFLRDNRGYVPDAALVEILGDVMGYKWIVQREATVAWVKDNNITVPFKVGDCVIVTRKFRGSIQTTVKVVLPETAEIAVSGNVEKKMQEGMICKIEDVTFCPDGEAPIAIS